MKKFFTLSIIATLSLYAQTFNVSNTFEFRQALQKAATDGENDTIILAPGIYKTTDDGKGTFKYYSTQDNNLTITGSDDNKTILSGDNKNQILNYINNSQNITTLTLKNIVFMDGNNTLEYGGGGAISCCSNILLKDCNFTNNHVGKYGDGGSVYVDFNVKIVNSVFNNNATGKYGYGGGVSSGYGNIEIINSVFNNNYADNDGGGFETDNGNVIVINSTFNNNYAGGDGGGFSSYKNATVINSKFINNSAPNDDGGGFKSNSATVINSMFINNNAFSGGAFYIDNEGNATVLNSLFIFNSSGISLSGNSKIYNSIFKDNNSSDIEGYNNKIYLYNNYIDLNKLKSNINTENIDLVSKNNIFEGVNLGFKDPEHGNYELTASSDLIDKGTTEGIENLIPKTDLAGNPRIVGKTIDIGPYEYQGIDTNQSMETNTTNETNTTSEVDIKVSAGWNMIDIPNEITNLSNINAMVIWEYENREWEVYSKDNTILKQLTLYYKPIKSLEAGSGVYVKEENASILKFENPKSTGINWLTLNIGWNLKGTGEDINLTTIPSKVKMVWYWDNPNKKWMVYSSDINISNLLQSYYSTGTFEKLDKLEANKAYWFFVSP